MEKQLSKFDKLLISKVVASGNLIPLMLMYEEYACTEELLLHVKSNHGINLKLAYEKFQHGEKYIVEVEGYNDEDFYNDDDKIEQPQLTEYELELTLQRGSDISLRNREEPIYDEPSDYMIENCWYYDPEVPLNWQVARPGNVPNWLNNIEMNNAVAERLRQEKEIRVVNIEEEEELDYEEDQYLETILEEDQFDEDQDKVDEAQVNDVMDVVEGDFRVMNTIDSTQCAIENILAGSSPQGKKLLTGRLQDLGIKYQNKIIDKRFKRKKVEKFYQLPGSESRQKNAGFRVPHKLAKYFKRQYPNDDLIIEETGTESFVQSHDPRTRQKLIKLIVANGWKIRVLVDENQSSDDCLHDEEIPSTAPV